MKYSGRGGYKALKAYRKDSRKYFEKNDKKESPELDDNTQPPKLGKVGNIAAFIFVLGVSLGYIYLIFTVEL